MKPGIVRGLWGDVLHKRLAYSLDPPDGYCSILRNVKDRAQSGDRTDRVYCWGTQNYEYCMWLGLPAVLVSPDPYVLPKLKKDRDRSSGGMMVWGMNIFWHRWELLTQALQDYDSVVAVDWDVAQVQPIPRGFWEARRAAGVPIQTTLIRIKNGKHAAAWRRDPSWGNPYQEGDGYYIGCGCCFWCGDRKFVEQCKQENLLHPPYDDQQTLSRVIDARHGDRWIGVNGWKQAGYEAEFIERNGQVIKRDPKQVIWQAQRGI